MYLLGVVSATTIRIERASTLLRHATSAQCAIANDKHDRTLFTSSAGLDHAKELVTAYKTGKIREMTPELWRAKKIIDSTIHPGTFDAVD